MEGGSGGGPVPLTQYCLFRFVDFVSVSMLLWETLLATLLETLLECLYLVRSMLHVFVN